MSSVKICCISDTHGYLPQRLPEADILIHAGDITHTRDLTEQAAFLNTKFLPWWKSQPHQYKYFIAGNHDGVLQQFPSLVDETKSEYGYLQDSIIEDKFKVYGSPWTPEYNNWAFMGDDKFLRHKYENLPKDIDIMITHGPPWGIMDESKDGDRCGSKALLEAVYRLHPKIHVFGHIHEGRDEVNVLRNGVTTFVNASIMNRNYRPNNQPTLLEITL